MKKGKLLMALIALLVLSSAALIAVNSKSSSPDTHKEEIVSTTEPLITFKKEDLKSLTMTDQEGSLTFLPTKEGWDIKDAPAISFDPHMIFTTCNSLLDISSSRTIEPSSLEEFGITKNSPKVDYTLANDKVSTLTLGAQTPDGNYTYVMKDDDNSKIHLISTVKGSKVSSSLIPYRIKSLDHFDITSFEGLEASGKALDTIILQPNSDASLLSAFMMSSPTTTTLPVSTESLQHLLSSLPDFSADEFIADEVTDLSLYGLDNPLLHLKLQVVDKADPSKINTLDYLWGNDLDEDSIYFTKAGTNSVYAMNSEAFYKFLEQLNVFNLSEKLVSLVNITNVESLDVSFEDTSYHLAIQRENSAPTNAESEGNETYFINHAECDENTFKSLYQSIIGIGADIDLTAKETTLTGTPKVTFTFNFLDGSHKTYPFYAHDNQFYVHKVDDKLIVGCNIKQFEYALKSLSEFTAR